MAQRVFQTSEQTAAIRKMMAARKRAWSTHTVHYPKWRPGMTTRTYVAAFNAGNRWGVVDEKCVPDTPAPFHASDFVLVEEVPEAVEAQPELLAA